MKVFEVKFSFSGKTFESEIQAANEEDAQNKLSEKLVVISIEEKHRKCIQK